MAYILAPHLELTKSVSTPYHRQHCILKRIRVLNFKTGGFIMAIFIMPVRLLKLKSG